MVKRMKKDLLRIGVAEIEITPPLGTPLCGALIPRVSIGTSDPLYIKAIVMESGGKRLAYVVFDLIALTRQFGDEGVKRSSERTGIPQEHIVWTATHTHTGPYVTPLFSDSSVVNEQWRSTLPEKMASCVEIADNAKVPAKVCRLRDFHWGLSQNRRIMLKNGSTVNTWNLGEVSEELQFTGMAGPIDPEIGIFSFEDYSGQLLAVMFHFTLHTNSNFGQKFSGDYPAVVAARVRERFGAQVVTLFLPGACADINKTIPSYRDIGNALSEKIIAAIERRVPQNGSLLLSAIKRDVRVPRRDAWADYEVRIASSGFNDKLQEIFRQELLYLQKEGKKDDTSIVQAWRMGDTAFVSFPRELFVEWGLKIKRESLFPWTYPVELGGDYLGYLVTERAWKEGGYESLLARSARPAPEGAALLVDHGLQMLRQLYEGEVI
ncbi:MAG: hypothetical protein WDA18_04255 [Candidatus Ratteibacteria bacterium]